jgi:hypothetical protein
MTMPHGQWCDVCGGPTVGRACPACLEKEVERLRIACSKQNNEIEQTLGKALGYPYIYVGETSTVGRAVVSPNFPGAEKTDEVCVGDHVAETLAVEASDKIEKLKAQVSNLVDENERLQSLQCVYCGEHVYSYGDWGNALNAVKAHDLVCEKAPWTDLQRKYNNVERVREDHEKQLVRIAKALGKDARDSADGTIAGLVENLKRDHDALVMQRDALMDEKTTAWNDARSRRGCAGAERKG